MKAVVHIVDDEDAVRSSLAALLEVHGFSTRVYESGEDFLARLDPLVAGCALVDLKMPGLDGLDVIRRMSESKVSLPVIMMTGFGEVAIAVKAMKSGAADFLEKPLDESELLAVLSRLAADSRAAVARASQREQSTARIGRLTEREREVFDRLAVGQTNKGIARELGISPRTVEIHRAHVMEKLEARTLSDIVRLGIVLGLPAQQ